MRIAFQAVCLAFRPYPYKKMKEVVFVVVAA
jgi:hypothetical protein